MSTTFFLYWKTCVVNWSTR